MPAQGKRHILVSGSPPIEAEKYLTRGAAAERLIRRAAEGPMDRRSVQELARALGLTVPKTGRLLALASSMPTIRGPRRTGLRPSSPPASSARPYRPAAGGAPTIQFVCRRPDHALRDSPQRVGIDPFTCHEEHWAFCPSGASGGHFWERTLHSGAAEIRRRMGRGSR